MVCDGVTCKRLKAPKPAQGSRYADGQKRCQECEIFMYVSINMIFCPCCNTRLRGKPRKMEYKDGYNAQVEAQGGVRSHNIIQNLKNSEANKEPNKYKPNPLSENYD